LDELARRVEEFGSFPFLVTTSAVGHPHVVSVAVTFDGSEFSLPAGRTSRANLAANGSVTLLWAGAGGPYGLIVDGAGRIDGDSDNVTVVPTRAVLHRLADAPTELASCVPIESTT
jgi:hypothetical protein